MTTEQMKTTHERPRTTDRVTVLAEAVFELSWVVDKLSGMIPMTCTDAREIIDALRIAMNYSFDISEGYMPED